jgi:Flp pilus assembly protein TadB
MEPSLERVGRELADSYPSLCTNLHITNLEIRAGRSMTEALEHLGDRLGLEEARALATLIQQSAELGSSITDALRVYSDDMRHKRLSRAEEKAYSLPAKLSLPMMICIFPVLFVVFCCRCSCGYTPVIIEHCARRIAFSNAFTLVHGATEQPTSMNRGHLLLPARLDAEREMAARNS